MGNIFLNFSKMPASKSISRSRTPVTKKPAAPKRSASNSKSVTPVKAVQKSAGKAEGGARKFYTVAEDMKVYSAWQEGTKGNSTVSDISKKMAAQLGRSEESVRDRIKRYLSKLNQGDEPKLKAAAKSTPNHHIHFVNDKQGHPWKTIGKITSDDPSFFKASSAKKVAVPVSAKKASPVKAARSSSKSPAPKAKASKSPVKGSALRKRTPEKSRSQSKTVTPVKSQKKVKTAEKSASKAPVPTFHMTGVADKELQGKVNSFLGGLNSKKNDDVKKNAEVLAEVVKGFSSSYGVELSDVMTLLAKEKDGVNCARVRSQLERM